MKTPLPLVVATAALAAVALWLASGSGDEPNPIASGEPASNAREIENATSAAQDNGPASDARDVVAAGAHDAIDLDFPHAFTLRVRAIDEFGLPQGGRRVRIAPIGCTQNVMEQRTDDSGHAIVEWKGRQSSMRMGLALGRGPVREIVVESGAPRSFVGLVPRDSGSISFTIQASGNGSAAFGFGGDGREQKLQLVASTDNEDSIDERRGLHPHARFRDRVLDGAPITPSPQALDALPLIGKVFTSVVGQQTDPAPQDNRRAAVTGVVFGEDGKPAAQQLVALFGEIDVPLATTRTDANGTYRFDTIRPGPARVRAGGQRSGLAEQAFVVGEVGSTTANLNLQRGQRIEGKVTAAAGKSLLGWIVEYEALDGQWVDRALVRDDGAFTLPNLPGSAARLLLREDANAVPTAIVASVLPDSGAVAFDLSGEAEPKGAITLQLQERQRAPSSADTEQGSRGAEQADTRPVEISFGGSVSEGATIRLDGSSFRLSNATPDSAAGARIASVFAWQVESGFCFSIPRAEDGSFACSGLRAGWYRLEARDVGIGTVELGQHFVDGKATVDLGVVRLPEPGRLRLEGRGPDTTIDLYHRRSWGDARAAEELGDRTEAEVPAGTWLAMWRTGDGPVVHREVVVEAGKTTILRLGE